MTSVDSALFLREPSENFLLIICKTDDAPFPQNWNKNLTGKAHFLVIWVKTFC